MRHSLKIPFVIFCSVLLGCSTQPVKQQNLSHKKNNSLKYAKRFAIEEQENFTWVYLFGDRSSWDTTSAFVIGRVTKVPIKRFPVYYVPTHCKRIVALSSIYASIFYELGEVKYLCGIDNIDYVINPAITRMFEHDSLIELAKMPQLNIERTVKLHPDIIFNFGMGLGLKDVDVKLAETKIPTAISVDHLEESPLARAEWIKFFAVFVNKKTMADSIFNAVETNYNQLKQLALKSIKQPSVFTETKYSDFWYMPGGNSFMAQLLKDAGSNYLWQDNKEFGSIPLSFEQVYARAQNADFWINLSVIKTKKELLLQEKRYQEFAAFKYGQLYNNTKYTNAKGYSTYWETGMIYPNRILNDLIQIFHPELKEQLKNDLYYYTRIH